MPNLSDKIENYIRERLTREDDVQLSRREIASLFQCAPSQLSYVIQTRFTNARGYNVETRRGVGGCFLVSRISEQKPFSEVVEKLMESEVETVESLLDNHMDSFLNKRVTRIGLDRENHHKSTRPNVSRGLSLARGIGAELTIERAERMLLALSQQSLITKREQALLSQLLSNHVSDNVRAQLFKKTIMILLKFSE